MTLNYVDIQETMKLDVDIHGSWIHWIYHSLHFFHFCIFVVEYILENILKDVCTFFQIPFGIQLENSHVIKPSQVYVSTIKKGPDGTVLNSSYRNR